MQDLQERGFQERLGKSEVLANLLMKFLVRKGHFFGFEKSSYEEDLNEAIDYWIEGPSGREAIQFKCRIKAGNADIPVVRYQPFWGIDSEATVVGRDYKGVMNGHTTQYYVVAMTRDGNVEVYRTSTAKLRPIIHDIDKAWSEPDPGDAFIEQGQFTNEFNSKFKRRLCNAQGKGIQLIYAPRSGGVNWQVWWQKNAGERFPKINYYLPISLKEDSWQVPRRLYNEMVRIAEGTTV